MIFISTGTEKYPFNRLLKAINEAKKSSLIKDEIVIQDCSIRDNDILSDYLRYTILPYEEMVKLVKNCDLYICHAGVGSIITGLSEGKIPIVVPRYAKYHEHVDNHQLDITDEFVKRGQIIACYDKDDLVDKINNYKTYTKNLTLGYNSSKEELLSFIKGII